MSRRTHYNKGRPAEPVFVRLDDNIALPVRYQNATITQPLKLADYWRDSARPGALEFLKLRSRGAGC